MPHGIEVYQFRWYLKGISPLIWRRVLVRNDSTGCVATSPAENGIPPVEQPEVEKVVQEKRSEVG